MKTIKLYGHLGKKYGKIHRYYIDTVAEAIQLLSANYPTFKKDLVDFEGGYRVIVGNEDIELTEVNNSFGKEQIKIVPIISGQGGLGKIVLGAALMYFSMGAASGIYGAFAEGLSVAQGAELWAVSQMAAGAMSSFGMSLILGGISEMLYVPPPAPTKHAVSGSFDGAVNTTRQGLPVPLGYGELIVGSAVISAGLTTTSVPVS